MRYGASPPIELVVLKAAEYFRCLPEDIENRMSKHWFDVWQVYLEEKQRG